MQEDKHVLRKLRESVGMTRDKFAALVGCSSVLVKKIEGGERPLTDKQLQRIYKATGCSRDELGGGFRGKALYHTGEQYSPRCLEEWRKLKKKRVAQFMRRWERLTAFFRWADILLEAAEEHGKTEEVYQSLITWLNESRRNFGLAATIDNKLKKQPFVTATRIFKVSELRGNSELAQWWGFKDDRSLHDVDEVQLKKQFWRRWSPEGPPLPEGPPTPKSG